METKIESKSYQFVKGDRLGEIVESSHVENEWTFFKDGSRFSTSLLNEYTMILTAGNKDQNLDVSIPTISDETNSSDKPLPASLRSTVIESTKADVIKPKEKENSKLNKLIGNIGEESTINLNVKVKLPTKDHYEILSLLNDQEEINNVISDYIINESKEQLINYLNKNYK